MGAAKTGDKRPVLLQTPMQSQMAPSFRRFGSASALPLGTAAGGGACGLLDLPTLPGAPNALPPLPGTAARFDGTPTCATPRYPATQLLSLRHAERRRPEASPRPGRRHRAVPQLRRGSTPSKLPPSIPPPRMPKLPSMSPAQVAPNRAPPRFSEARGPPPLPVQGQGSFGAVTTVDPMRGQRRSVEVDTLAVAHVMGRGDTNCDVRMDLSEQVTVYGERDAAPARDASTTLRRRIASRAARGRRRRRRRSRARPVGSLPRRHPAAATPRRRSARAR